MELVRLNDVSWEIAGLVEDYTSLIWTERYLGAGDFTLKTWDVENTRNLLPRKQKVSLRDSQEVMTVETHSIEVVDGKKELTVTGRTFETILECRSTIIIQDNDGDKNNMWYYEDDEIWPTVAAKGLIMTHLTECNEEPMQRFENVAVAVIISADDHEGEQMSYEYTIGPLYPEIMGLLRMEHAGIRNQLDNDGVLKIYIYKGKNRTVHQNDNAAIIFRLDMGHIVDPKYLWSLKDYRNVAYVVGDAWQQVVYAPGVSHTMRGEDRRILHVDGNNIKDKMMIVDPNPDPDVQHPPRIEVDRPAAMKRRQAKALGLKALAKQNDTFFFDAEVSPTSPYVRNVHYNLGDKITLMGDHGVSQSMIVSEFVRTEDQDGERSYPTLVVPNELEAQT